MRNARTDRVIDVSAGDIITRRDSHHPSACFESSGSIVIISDNLPTR